MGHIRLLHPRHWDVTRRRFDKIAFKKSSDGGLSVVEVECANATSGLICEHLATFYPGVGGDPAVFMLVDDGEWPVGSNITPTVLENNDECHREVDGVSNGQLQRLFQSRDWHGFLICDPMGVRNLTDEDVDSFGG